MSTIVAAGIDSSDRLARTPLLEIERRLDINLTPEAREGLDGLILFAKAENNLLMDAAALKKQDWLAQFKVPDSIIAPQPDDDDDGATAQQCVDCDECATVFSPLAYAYDLVTFIEDTWDVDPQKIEALILQDIDLDCDKAQEPVQQIVLAIEVLERYVEGERQRPVSSIRRWPERYRAFADAVLRAFDLDPELRRVPRDLSDLYAAARNPTPTVAAILRLVDLAGRYYESEIASEKVSDPERPTSNDDEAYAAYLAQRTQAETQRQQLQHSFAQHLESLIAPVLIDYRTLLISAAAREASDLEQLLFIDLQTAACKQTTRNVQIIQSLHSLVLSVRTRTIVKNDRTVVAGAGFDPDRFDEVSWHWLQTYAAWNAAMYVLVYPENLLSPPVYQHRMTGFYRDVASELMAGHASAEIVATMEQRFASYFRVFETLQPFAASVIGEAADERLVIFARAKSGSDHSLWMNTIETAHFPWGNQPAVEQINADGWTQVPGWRDDLHPVMALPYGETGTERFIVLGSGRAARWTTYRIGTEGELIGESALQNVQEMHEVVLSTGASLANNTPVVWTAQEDQWYISEFDVSTGEWPEPVESALPWFKTVRFTRTTPGNQGGGSQVVQTATTRVGAALTAVKRDSTKANGAAIVLSYDGYYGDQPYVPKNLQRFFSDQDYGNYVPILAWSRTRSSCIVFRSSKDNHIYVSRVHLNTDSTTEFGRAPCDGTD